jgi:hypothetical protein
MTASSQRRPWRQVAAAFAVICVGVVAVAMIVGHAQLSASQQVYMLMPKNQLTTELWFGPGISDDLNRMVNIGTSPRALPPASVPHRISHPHGSSCRPAAQPSQVLLDSPAALPEGVWGRAAGVYAPAPDEYAAEQGRVCRRS